MTDGRQPVRQRFGLPALLWVLIMIGSAQAPDPAAGADSETTMRLARLLPEPRPEPVERGLVRPLSLHDAATYRRIFELQEEGRFVEADRLIARVRDPLLMGHVLAQRYLHPTAYRSRYPELHAWLEQYADHPDADRIYRLALRRRPEGAPPPAKPVSGYLGGAGQNAISFTDALDDEAAPPPDGSARAFLARLEQLVDQGRAEDAQRALHGAVWNRLSQVDQDRARLLVARGLFFEERPNGAFALADAVAQRSGQELPLAHWIAGLAAWKLGRHGDAARNFGALARHDQAEAEARAGAAFWAARANLVTGRPQLAARFLELASDSSRGFYGLLASATLGKPIGFDWQPTIVEDETLSLLAHFPGSRRALALAQVGQWQRAEAEIRKLAARARPRLLRALSALAESFELPSAQMRVAQRLVAIDDSRHDLALYPAPKWQPEGGLRIDRALLFAFVRAETGFLAGARSHRGARGLMQLLPQTAKRIAEVAGIAYAGPEDLDNPAKNLALGQAYLEHLLEHPLAGRSLVHLALAYNAGLSRLVKWTERLAGRTDDPLLFIESIPVEESRVYVRKLLANLWAYRIRFGQPAPSLEALAANEWPRYVPVDGTGSERYARAD